MSLHMMAKDVDIYGMYLVVNGNETKYVKEFYKLWHSKYVN
jgi:hypothetical protein